METVDWNEQAKRLLKSELVRRGISSEELVARLERLGVDETKASVESKISRGTFSAAFLLQALNAIGCKSFVAEVDSIGIVLRSNLDTKTSKTKKNKN